MTYNVFDGTLNLAQPVPPSPLNFFCGVAVENTVKIIFTVF